MQNDSQNDPAHDPNNLSLFIRFDSDAANKDCNRKNVLMAHFKKVKFCCFCKNFVVFWFDYDFCLVYFVCLFFFLFVYFFIVFSIVLSLSQKFMLYMFSFFAKIQYFKQYLVENHSK